MNSAISGQGGGLLIECLPPMQKALGSTSTLQKQNKIINTKQPCGILTFPSRVLTATHPLSLAPLPVGQGKSVIEQGGGGNYRRKLV